MKTFGLVLAAGKGTRMKTDIAKCMFPILDEPIIEHVVDRLEKSKYVDEVIVVVGHKKESFYDYLKDRVKYAVQENQKGTADAVASAKNILKGQSGYTIIVPGDVPLMTPELTDDIIEHHIENNNDLTVCTMKVDNPFGYGRIIKDENDNILKIVEQKHLTDDEQSINEVNTAIFVVDNKTLFEKLDLIKPNDVNGEYYLTDLVELLNKEYQVRTFLIEDHWQTLGINDIVQANVVEEYLIDKINKFHMLNGVIIKSPKTVRINKDVQIDSGVTIEQNTIIRGKSIIKEGSIVGPNTTLVNAIINENVKVEDSIVKDSTIYNESYVGPYAHIRDGAVIGVNTRIGNYVEIKNSKLGNDIFVSHHAYIGDATIGDRVNFGCGSITVNFDGEDKHETVIEDDVFIGCNVNLIAPIKISKESFIAAGSTVTQDVKAGDLIIARSKEVVKEGYYYNYFKKQNK